MSNFEGDVGPASGLSDVPQASNLRPVQTGPPPRRTEQGLQVITPVDSNLGGTKGQAGMPAPQER